MKISDAGAGEEYGIQDLPSLVYFENGVPEIFEGDIRNDNQIIKWMLDELKQEEIKDVTVAMLNRLIDRNHNLAVVFMDEESKEGRYYCFNNITKERMDIYIYIYFYSRRDSPGRTGKY